MSQKISQLPVATQANPTDAFEKSDQGGAPSQQVTLAQIQVAENILNTLAPTAGTSYTVDFNVPDNTITTASQLDFTATANRSSAATRSRSATVRVASNAGGARALTFNANWVFLGPGLPTTIAANKVGILTLKCYGTAETDVIAAWSVQP